MKHLFLTSSIGTPGVAESICAKLGLHKPLKTAFITTPVEPPSEQEDLSWYETDRAALTKNSFDFFDYTITGKTLKQIKQDLVDIEVLYVSGGDSNYLLEQSQKSGFIDFVRNYANTGKPYIGTSAGSIITGPMLPHYLWIDESRVVNLKDFTAYGLVNFTLIPHWGCRFFKDLYLGGRMSQIYLESLQPFVLCNDHQYVEVTDDWYKIIDVTKK